MRLLAGCEEDRRIDGVDAAPLLHLVKHRGQTCFHLQRLLYFVGGNERILTIFEEARALMFAHEFDECGGIRFPIQWEALKIFEDCINTGLLEESDCVLGIFVEVSIEYPLVHEIRVAADVEQDPSQIMEFEWSENERITSDSTLYFFAVRADHILPPRFDLGDNCEAIIGRGLGIGRTVASVLKFEISSLGMAIAAGLVQSPALARDTS
jgi:hypothetical protein